jgi:hypothetical protein
VRISVRDCARMRSIDALYVKVGLDQFSLV